MVIESGSRRLSKCRSNCCGKHDGDGEHPDEVIPEKAEIIEENPDETPAGAPREIPSGGIGSAGISEVLDQHRQWVESGGSAGARGDFAGAELAERI